MDRMSQKGNLRNSAAVEGQDGSRVPGDKVSLKFEELYRSICRTLAD